VDPEDDVLRAHRLTQLKEREPPAGDGIGQARELGHAAVFDGGVGGAVAAGLLLQESEAVRLDEDDHRLAEVLRPLHEQLEVTEVAAHRARVLHLLQERRLAAAVA
jgi:hypothetical protein